MSSIAQTFNKTPYSKKTFEALWDISKVVLETTDFEEATQKVTNIVLNVLGDLKYGYDAIVLTLLDQTNNQLRRIAISKTDVAAQFLKTTPIPFDEIIIPLNAENNLTVKAVKQKQIQVTGNMVDILYPGLPIDWITSLQKNLGTKTGLVFPITAKQKTLGALIFTLNKERSKITKEEWIILETFVGSVGIALDNALLFKSLNETSTQLAHANSRLKNLDKLKDDFVSVASHELRTPMTAIKSYLWVALNSKKENLSEDMKRYVSRAYISVERLISLVNDMLNISRIEGGRIALRLEDTDILALSHTVQEEVRAKAREKNIDVVIIEKRLPTVLCDSDKIHEVLLNLIGNSLKFTKAGGNITVNYFVEGEFVRVSVMDTGVGITQVNLKRLFSKFGRLDNSYVAVAESGGTGLGLYISKSLIDLHKGKIWAASEGADKGTTFSFTLPVSESKIATELARSAPKSGDNTKELEKTKLFIS